MVLMSMSTTAAAASSVASSTSQDVSFLRCSRRCKTCADMVFCTDFRSSVSGTKFDCIFEFDVGEKKVINCKSTNVIYLLSCKCCYSQYVGETVQELKDRMSQHRGTTNPTGNSGNFRLRQHFLESVNCNSFSVQIIQKLAGTGRIGIKRPNSNKFVIDDNITKIRKEYEDRWIRVLKTQFPYGINDRIDSLANKDSYNCEYAKFISCKDCSRKRSWADRQQSDLSQVVIDNILGELLRLVVKPFHSDVNILLRKLLFPLNKSTLVKLKESYLDKVFQIDNLDPSRSQIHCIIMDLFTYKIRPFNSRTDKSKSVRKPKVLCSIDFVNKGIEMLNLPRVFRSPNLKSFVNFCNIKEPTVVYKGTDNVSKKLFNYNNVVKGDNDPLECKCHMFTDFVNQDCGHVVTGDVKFVKHDALRSLLEKGPSYKEPKTIDFDKNCISVISNVKEILEPWSRKEKIDSACLNGWFNEFSDIIKKVTKDLKINYSKQLKRESVFNNVEACKELAFIRKYFVLCPVDKATKNVAIICKQYYLSDILQECQSNEGIDDVSGEHEVRDINRDIFKFMEDVGIKVDSKVDNLPHMFSSPKFHKPILKFRYVISYANCSLKPLAVKISLALKAVYSEICRYTNMLFKVTGVNRNWVILNNKPILEALNRINDTSLARNIQTFDFSTLYTNLAHKDIKDALKFTVKLAFRNNKKKFIAVYDKGFAWVNSFRNGTVAFDEVKLIKCVEFLLDNCYFKVGEILYRQHIGVPIGINPGPYIANLTLWYFENSFLDSTYKSRYYIVKKLNNTFRLIDDITTLNSDGYLEEYFKLIYPDSLTLNKENEVDSAANVLDLDISINREGKFSCRVYDKRDKFGFKVVKFQPLMSNQASSVLYGTYCSQVVRYSRICNNVVAFSDRVLKFTDDLIELGFRRDRLSKIYLSVVKRHGLKNKFGIGCRNILMP